VKGDCHDSIGSVEGFLDAVAVMDVYVDVEDPEMCPVIVPPRSAPPLRLWATRNAPQQLKDGKHNVVDVAEATGLALLGVVEPASPVDGHVGGAGVERRSSSQGAAGGDGAELEEPREGGTVFADEDCVAWWVSAPR
jgi:hypothetical protein